MKAIKRTLVLVALAFIMAGMLSACSIFSDAAKLQEYDFDSDKIPTINSQVGERKVTGVETSVTNGEPQKQYTYESSTVADDILAYMQYLVDNGWITTQAYDLTVSPGSVQLARESADAGKVLVISIAYEGSKYAIKITKTDGTLTAN